MSTDASTCTSPPRHGRKGEEPAGIEGCVRDRAFHVYRRPSLGDVLQRVRFLARRFRKAEHRVDRRGYREPGSQSPCANIQVPQRRIEEPWRVFLPAEWLTMTPATLSAMAS